MPKMKSNKYGYEGQVLVIDGPSSIIQHIISALSIEYFHTFDNKEAVKFAEINQPALVFINVYFPKLHTISAYEMLSSNDKTKHIPIVITGDGVQCH